MKLFKRCKDGVHKFEGRHDKSEAKIPWDGLKSIEMSPRAMNNLRRITYVRDVCVRCGETIERQSQVEPLVRSA